MNNKKGIRLKETGIAHIFVRKTKKGDPPYIYLGKGKLTNARDANNPAFALLFDIELEEPIPEEYDYDLGYKEID